MKKIFTIILLLSMFVLQACMSIQSASVTNPNVVINKIGQDCGTGIWNFVPFFSDYNVFKAMQNGGITQVHSTEVTIKWYVLWNENCIVVHGN
jgi:hypothetical protein